ncbi:hypothetical protein D9M68_888730 [compost metagenome]
MVGTSGASADRAWPVTPRARSLSDLTWGRPVAVSVIIMSIWPPSRSVIASGLLLYGTCSSWMFAICCSSSPAMRLLELPLPKLSLPGCCLACARNSPTVLADDLGLTTMIWPPLPSSVSGA